MCQNKSFPCTVGHGLSEGDRVHITRFRTYVDDVIQHVDIVKKKYPEISCFLVGHSMVNFRFH